MPGCHMFRGDIVSPVYAHTLAHTLTHLRQTWTEEGITGERLTRQLSLPLDHGGRADYAPSAACSDAPGGTSRAEQLWRV